MPFGRLGQAARAQEEKKGKVSIKFPWCSRWLWWIFRFGRIGTSNVFDSNNGPLLMVIYSWLFFFLFSSRNWIEFGVLVDGEQENWKNRSEITELLIWPKSILWHYFLEKRNHFGMFDMKYNTWSADVPHLGLEIENACNSPIYIDSKIFRIRISSSNQIYCNNTAHL